MKYFQKKAVVMVQEFQAFWKQSKFQPKTYIHKKRAWMKIAHIFNSKNDRKIYYHHFKLALCCLNPF